MSTRTVRAVIWRTFAAVALATLPETAALANDTCNGFVNIDYVGAPPVTPIGDTVEMKVSFGTGSIQGGTSLTIESFQLNLDCNANFPLTPPCTDEGPLVQYEGDVTITTDCPGIAWTTGHAVSPNPNEVIFTATPALVIPANQPTLPGFCSITFTVRVLGASVDVTPNKLEQLVGYDIAACDNGVLLSGGFQTGAIETPPALHFSCYEVVQGNIVDVPGVTLQDVFGATTVTVQEAKRICAPTNKNGEDPGAPLQSDHLMAYRFTKTAGASQKVKGVKVTNQFGGLTVDVVSPALLLTPSAKSLVPPFPPALVSSPVPHFQCYKLDNVKGDKDRTGISLEDQFGPLTVDLDKRGPFRLCAPVNKNGEDPAALTNPNFLLCYTTRNDKLPFPDLVVFTNNQFGPLTTKFTQYDELCVPSSVVLP